MMHEYLGYDDPASTYLLWQTLRNTVATTDKLIREYTPQFVEKLIAIQDSLNSDNPEHWANAANSMRKIFEKLADNVYPPVDKGVVLKGGKEVRIGKKNYANRIKCFLEDNISSRNEIGIEIASLNFFQAQRQRLDAILAGSNQGTHAEFQGRQEAELYILHGYLMIGDILRAVDVKTYDR